MLSKFLHAIHDKLICSQLSRELILKHASSRLLFSSVASLSQIRTIVEMTAFLRQTMADKQVDFPQPAVASLGSTRSQSRMSRLCRGHSCSHSTAQHCAAAETATAGGTALDSNAGPTPAANQGAVATAKTARWKCIVTDF